MSRKRYAGDVSLNPVYLSARSAIITPERAIGVTIYALKKWLPRLGPERWSLIQLLRGLCFDADRRPDGTKRVTTSWKSLGELLQVHEETIASWLKHEPIPDDKPWRRIMPSDDYSEYLSLFIPRLRYAYETRNGKTRRVGFLLEVLMEDPVAPEDEVRLTHQVELMRYEQKQFGLADAQSFNPAQTELHPLSQTTVNQVSTPEVGSPNHNQSDQHGLTQGFVNPGNPDSQPPVKQYYVDSLVDVILDSTDLPYDKSEEIRENVNQLSQLIEQLKQLKHYKRNYLQILEPVITFTERLLDDYHSTKMLYKVLRVLFPDYMDIYVLAIEKALIAASVKPKVNKGAVFVSTIRQYADEAEIDLGLQSSDDTAGGHQPTVPGRIESREISMSSQNSVSSVEEAIWSETLSKLQGQMTKGAFDSVMQKTNLVSIEDDIYIVQVAAPSAKEWLENRWRAVVERALSSVIGVKVKVSFRL
jgi:hypothetical protein